MDANYFKSSIRELINHVMTGHVNSLNVAEINAVLQYAIQNNTIEDNDVQALIIALMHAPVELPYFTILQINLINELFLYTHFLTKATLQSQVETAETFIPTSRTSKKAIETCSAPMPTQDKPNELGLTPEKIAATAGMFHKEMQIDPENHTKTVTTYEHLSDGTLRLVSQETLTEPQDDEIFANILGKSFKQDDTSPRVNANDL